MILVVSGFQPDFGLARPFLQSYTRFCPHKLAVYVEEPFEFSDSKVEFRSLWDCQGQKAFIEQFEHVPQANGYISPLGDFQDRRFVAVKFSRQAYIPAHAIKNMEDGDIMVWLDADVMTFKAIPPLFIENLVAGYDLVTTGDRSPWHKATDIGFWAIRVSPVTRKLVAKFVDFYQARELFRLREWHSGFVFDRTVDKLKKKLKIRHLAPRQHKKCHIWFKTPLGEYMDHLAGEARKEMGRSHERPS